MSWESAVGGLSLIAQQIEDTRPPMWLWGIAPFLASPVGLIFVAIFVLVIVAWLAADYQRRQRRRDGT